MGSVDLPSEIMVIASEKPLKPPSGTENCSRSARVRRFARALHSSYRYLVSCFVWSIGGRWRGRHHRRRYGTAVRHMWYIRDWEAQRDGRTRVWLASNLDLAALRLHQAPGDG